MTAQDQMVVSRNDYDWLGHGYYFWENNDKRALSFAEENKGKPRKGKITIVAPSVLGAVLDLGNCLDLLDSRNIDLLRVAHSVLLAELGDGEEIPTNDKFVAGHPMRRRLDCAVVETLHQMNQGLGRPGFDSVRAMFPEGNPLYPEAGFQEKNHIQICVRNPDCIKGFFIPRKATGTAT